MILEIVETRDLLIKLLKDEAARARALFDSLKSESEALSCLDEKLITINSARKQKLIEALQLASETRISYMEENGISTSAVKIKEYTISSDSDTELDTLFIQLSELAQKCFDQNRLIGQLINRRTQFITQTLSTLSPSACEKNLTYGENGNFSNMGEAGSSLFHLAKI